MTATKKLNKLAIKAKEDCQQAIKELCEHYLPILNRESERIWYRIRDEAKFECDCLKMIRHSIYIFDENKGSFDSLIRYKINGLVKTHLKRSKGKITNQSIDKTLATDDGEMMIDVIDYSTSVEGEVFSKDIIRTLARGDDMNFEILIHWSNGLTNDAEISRLLAQSFGGNPTSHRKRIQRFRESCRNLLNQLGYSG